MKNAASASATAPLSSCSARLSPVRRLCLSDRELRLLDARCSRPLRRFPPRLRSRLLLESLRRDCFFLLCLRLSLLPPSRRRLLLPGDLDRECERDALRRRFLLRGDDERCLWRRRRGTNPPGIASVAATASGAAGAASRFVSGCPAAAPPRAPSPFASTAAAVATDGADAEVVAGPTPVFAVFVSPLGVAAKKSAAVRRDREPLLRAGASGLRDGVDALAPARPDASPRLTTSPTRAASKLPWPIFSQSSSVAPAVPSPVPSARDDEAPLAWALPGGQAQASQGYTAQFR